MEFKGDEPGTRSSAMLTEPASTTVIELDLYDELLSFSTLSSEEQRKELERVAQLLAARPGQPTGAEEQRRELELISIAIEDGPIVCDPSDKREGTGPFADMVSGVNPSVETMLSCGNCGAASSAEDLFCLSCGELVAEVEL